MHHPKTLARILLLGSCLIAFAGSRAEPEAAAGQVPQWAGFEEMHQFFVEAFVNSEKFGLARVFRADLPLVKTIEVGGKTYRAGALQLVSLLKKPRRPRVYRTVGSPTKSDLEHVTKRRRLDDFESYALAVLRSGESVVFQSQGETVRALGAIRARPECLQCHGGDTGSLLGAFSYRLVPADADVGGWDNANASRVMLGGR